jgi:hypothetical protein
MAEIAPDVNCCQMRHVRRGNVRAVCRAPHDVGDPVHRLDYCDGLLRCVAVEPGQVPNLQTRRCVCSLGSPCCENRRVGWVPVNSMDGRFFLDANHRRVRLTHVPYVHSTLVATLQPSGQLPRLRTANTKVANRHLHTPDHDKLAVVWRTSIAWVQGNGHGGGGAQTDTNVRHSLTDTNTRHSLPRKEHQKRKYRARQSTTQNEKFWSC